MGMLDIARILGNQTALAVLKDATPWFRQFLDGIDDDNLAHMVNIEETGGIMELWADLYAFTGWEDALCLMRKMERRELFDAMLAGPGAGFLRRKPLPGNRRGDLLPAADGRGQQHGFRLRPLREIGKERYTVYFPIEKTKPV